MPETNKNGTTEEKDQGKPGSTTTSTYIKKEELTDGPDPVVSPDPSTPDPAYDPATEEGT